MPVIINHPVEPHIDPPVHLERIWQNDAPTTAIGEFSVTLDLSRFQFVYIIGVDYTSTGRLMPGLLLPIAFASGVLGGIREGGEAMVARSVTITEAGITFGTGYRALDGGGTTNESSSYAIPYQIYGVRA